MSDHPGQRQKILQLLTTAHTLAVDLQEGPLIYLIERAKDEAFAAVLDPTPRELDFLMCGKFTSMASWREIAAFSQPLTSDRFKTNDQPVPLRVMSDIPVIVFDREAKQRRVVMMRWGFPHRSNPNRPDPDAVLRITDDGYVRHSSFKG